MIPWVREKFAEKRAKWQAARNKRTATDKEALDSKEEEQVNDEQVQTVEATVVRNRQESSPNGTSRSDTRRRASPATTPSLQSTRISKLKSRHNSASTSSSCANSNETLTKRAAIKERIKVCVICPSGRVLSFQTDINKRLAELKNEVILELSDDPTSMPLFAPDVRQLSPRYRLFRAEYVGTEVNESLTLEQLQIMDNDMLVLVQRRNHLQQMSIQTRETHAPREHEIETATNNVPARLVDMPMIDINEIFQQSNLQFDVRKVLISLAQASAAIIGSGPYANRLVEMLKQKLVNKRNHQNDTLQCLVDMGFKKEKAEHALRIHHNVYATALEWLIQRQSEETPTDEAVGLQKSQSIMSPSGILTNENIIENTEALLEIVRIYSHRDIPPSPSTVNALVEMGFEEKDVLNALKKTCNNKAAACEWLCGNRTGSLVELRDGLAQDSPILKSILEMPHVQINLSNPKMLLAFLSILENENSIRVWGGDSDTTTVITHILQKYHEEKHVLGINQFYSNRQ